MAGKEQARLLGLLLWIFSGFQLFVIGLVGIIYVVFAGVFVSTAPRKANEPDPALILPFIVVIFAIVGGVFLLFSIPKIVAGYGLRKEKSWAKPWAIVACIMACMNFPFGTAVGVYGLVFVFGDEGKRYFDNQAYGSFPLDNSQINPPPPPNSWQ